MEQKQQALPLLPTTHWQGMGNPCHLLGWAHLTLGLSPNRYVRHFYLFALPFFFISVLHCLSASSSACLLLVWDCVSASSMDRMYDDGCHALALYCSVSSVRRRVARSCLRRFIFFLKKFIISPLDRLESNSTFVASTYLLYIFIPFYRYTYDRTCIYSTNTVPGFTMHPPSLFDPFSAPVRASALGGLSLPEAFSLPIPLEATNPSLRPGRSAGG